MLLSLSLIFIMGFILGYICRRIKLPQIIGMLLTGIILGPFILDLLDSSLLSVSPELRKIALLIILLKAGFSLELSDLKKVGRPAILLSFIPAVFEITGYIVLAPRFLAITAAEAAIMGTVLAAVSPAVVVPRMIELIEKGYGTKKGIPQMIVAGASCDDILVILLFTTFLGMGQGREVSFSSFINIPHSIISGILTGFLSGYLLHIFFERSYKKNRYIRNSTKIIIILSLSFLLISLENLLKGKFALSGLLAVMSMAMTLKMKSPNFVSKRLSEKFGKLWIAAEVVLFVLVGAAVDIRYTLEAGVFLILMIFSALVFRAAGVVLSLIKTDLSWEERMFCVIAYLPKATVQAAIGAVPLSLGLKSGRIILSAAVMAIIITAPLGALGIDMTYEKLLK